ncbi:hypothetical protein K6W26_23020 [Burkholderia sp. AU42008]|uniref:hypothetical protein n=1 Tax=unclassified Burkholderia TaxID=2613784 RepID=UPI000B7A0D4C|nr:MULTISPECIES: hypothetical protein [unclassified Burkholderia]MBR8234628.1 hypothetical protein [Burkholderia sp. AU32357]MBY4875929.1 hypothetical protein [Burkholderia sp. AU42008]OXI44919.1 hypothetical protein CFB49_07625 [Burkholderia sp. AU17457]
MNVKPGDLAIMVRSEIPENIGRIFEVLSFNDAASDLFGPTWNVRAVRPAKYGDGRMGTEGAAQDCCLRPINGVPVTDDISNEVTA